MNIQELIHYLEQCKNRTKEVYVWADGELFPIVLVDDSMHDRLDLNIEIPDIEQEDRVRFL